MTERSYRMQAREFLNHPGHHAGAHVILSVSDSGAGNGRGHSICTIADCHESISLSFPLNETEMDNSVDKAVLLATLFMDFAIALQEEAIAVREWREAAKRKKAEGKPLDEDEKWELED